jgi:hypothetical protein
VGGDHDAAQVLSPQPAEDLRREIGATEADQEQLRHLALQGKPAREVGHGARHRRPPAATLALGRRGHDPGEERDPLLGRAAPRTGHIRGSVALVAVMPGTHDHPSGPRSQRQHRHQDDQQPAPSWFGLHTRERYSLGPP